MDFFILFFSLSILIDYDEQNDDDHSRQLKEEREEGKRTLIVILCQKAENKKNLQPSVSAVDIRNKQILCFSSQQWCMSKVTTYVWLTNRREKKKWFVDRNYLLIEMHWFENRIDILRRIWMQTI